MNFQTLFLLFCFFGFSVVFASNHYEYSRTIFLHNREIDTTSTACHTNFDSKEFGLFYVTFKPMLTSQPQAIQDFQDEYHILLDDYLPISTYILYAPSDLVGKISADSRVVWVGAVPYIDKIPFNLTKPTENNQFVVHFAECMDCPSFTEEVSALAQRMEGRFDASSFSWGKMVDDSHLALLTINDAELQEKILTWVLRKGSQRIRFLEIAPINLPSGKFANHITADGSFVDCGDSCDYPIAVTPLTGAGEIIALVDTGLDGNNCFFQDPNGIPYDDLDDTRRKVISYVTTLGDDKDNNGHGSSVASLATGVAGGSSSSSDITANSIFNGLSSGAKLVVMDVLSAGSNILNIPLDALASRLLNIVYNLNARVGLFPWGATITQAGSKSFYSIQDQGFDDFIFNQKDFIAIFSVGNEGNLGASRIQSAASAKNTIGVGGSLNAHSAYEYSDYIDNADALAKAQYTRYCTIGDVSAYNDPVFCNQQGRPAPCPSYQTTLCPPTGSFDGTPSSCCGFPYFAPLCCPAIITSLSRSSTLLYTEKTVWPYTSRGPTYDHRIKPDVLAPADRLYSALYDPDATGAFCGPWTDNPTAGQAATVTEGTSGAAGVVAGAAALVREWLRGGYWPTGNPADPLAFPFPEPIKSSLVKALLINSAEPLQLINHNRAAYWETIGSQLYSDVQGFGRINLKNVLTTVDNPTPPVYILSDISIPYSNYTDTRCIRINDGASFLRITAVWIDPPASPNAGVALVNNIDLVLVRDDGFEYRSNGKATFDSVNNVEDIIIINPPGGSYAIKLHGTYITTSGTQLVDLVMRGDLACTNFRCLEATSVCSFPSRAAPLDCALRSGASSINGDCVCSAPYYGIDCTLTPCPNNCNGNGVCDGETGTCVCDDFWKGSDCSVADATGTPAGCNTVVITEDCSNPGVDEGITIGVTIGAFFLGAILFFIFGAWLSMHLMLRRKKKMIAKYRQMKAHDGGGKGLNPQIAPDDDE